MTVPVLSDTAATVVGDLWQLGKHRVLCGNSLAADSYERLMQGERADFPISDAPYNVVIDGHASGNGAIQHREFAASLRRALDSRGASPETLMAVLRNF
jgi:DNA modification methylase